MNGRHSASSTSSSSTAAPVGSSHHPNRHGHPGNHFPQSQQHSSPTPQLVQGVLHQPSSVGEWQLFAVLHRANLLQYYDTFISQGGDDINQLLEAGEEEFLEIMALVGMASKPLHVRRMQKTLQEYSISPTTFQIFAMQKSGVVPPNGSSGVINGPVLPHFSPSAASLLTTNPILAASTGIAPPSSRAIHPPRLSHRPTSAQTPTPTVSSLQHLANMTGDGATPAAAAASALPNSAILGVGQSSGGSSAAPAISVATSDSPGATSVRSSGSSNVWPSPRADAYDLVVSDPYIAAGTTPTLTELQVQRLAECAVEILRHVPDAEPKVIQNKKSREILAIVELPLDSTVRADEIRRFSAIYGRFNAKRKADKPLSLHEVLVNEAAAQICFHRPALLTRRDELFPLARQVVKAAGYNYAIPKPSRRVKSEHEEVLMESSLLTMHKRTPPSESASGNSEEIDGSGSPAPSTSSTSQTSPGAGTLTISLSPPAAVNGGCSDSSLSSSSATTMASAGKLPSATKRPKRRLEEIGMELQRVNAEQEAWKRRVNEAQEMGDVICIQHQLKQLTRRQLELSDEEAALKTPAESFAGGQESVQMGK